MSNNLVEPKELSQSPFRNQSHCGLCGACYWQTFFREARRSPLGQA